MPIGVLGTGDVGRVLGAGFAKNGHQVMIGSRDPKQEKVQAWVQATGRAASAGAFAEAAAFGEVAVLATTRSGTESALALAGPSPFDRKVVIDVGGIASSRNLETMAMVWILHDFKTGSGRHAFKMPSK